jgi:hypothetical protein
MPSALHQVTAKIGGLPDVRATERRYASAVKDEQVRRGSVRTDNAPYEAMGYLLDELGGVTLPMLCSDFFQPFIDYLNQPMTDPQIFNIVTFLLAGNRAETADTRFVLYTQGFFDEVVPGEATQLSGSAFQLFSNKSAVTSGTEQPFDIHLSKEVKVSLAVPDGPLAFLDLNMGQVIEQFGTFECRENGFLLCSSTSGNSLLVLSFAESIQDLRDFERTQAQG